MHGPSALARLALMPLWRMVRWGLDRTELLNAAKIDESQLRDPDTRIPLSSIANLWHAAALRVPDLAFGLRLGADVRVREFGLVGYAMAYSGTVEQALKRLDRYDRIVSDALVVDLDPRSGGTWMLVDVQPALQAFRPAVDARLAALLSVCREIAAARIDPLVVHLPYRRPADVGDYEKFFRGPLEFGSATTALVFDKDDLARSRRPTRASPATSTSSPSSTGFASAPSRPTRPCSSISWPGLRAPCSRATPPDPQLERGPKVSYRRSLGGETIEADPEVTRRK